MRSQPTLEAGVSPQLGSLDGCQGHAHSSGLSSALTHAWPGAKPTCAPASTGLWVAPPTCTGPSPQEASLRGTLPRAQRVAGAEKWGEGSPVLSREGLVMPLGEAPRPEAGKGVACWCRGQRGRGRLRRVGRSWTQSLAPRALSREGALSPGLHAASGCCVGVQAAEEEGAGGRLQSAQESPVVAWECREQACLHTSWQVWVMDYAEGDESGRHDVHPGFCLSDWWILRDIRHSL